MDCTPQVFLFMIDKCSERLINVGSVDRASPSTVLPMRHAYPPGEYGKAAELCGGRPRHPLCPTFCTPALLTRPWRAGIGPWLSW